MSFIDWIVGVAFFIGLNIVNSIILWVLISPIQLSLFQGLSLVSLFFIITILLVIHLLNMFIE